MCIEKIMHNICCDQVTIVNPVSDFITIDVSVRFIRVIPHEHYGGKTLLAHEIRDRTRSYKTTAKSTATAMTTTITIKVSLYS